jgi:hypothetical protein
MIGMFVSTSENSIDNQSAPVHLQWLEASLLPVGWFDTMTAFGIIIVHDHRIYTQFDQMGFFDVQAPDKKRLQESTEQKNTRPGKRVEKAFHPVRRSHIVHIGFNTAGISGIIAQLIKPGEMPAGTIEHETQHLLHQFSDFKPLFVFSDGAEKSVQYRKNLNLVQVGDKQSQAGSTGQAVICGFDRADLQFSFPIIFVMFVHKVLYLVGLLLLIIFWGKFNKHYSMLQQV